MYDRLLITRVASHLSSRMFYSPRQHGFVGGKSTASAIRTVVEYCECELKEGRKVLLLSLDVDGAFNNAWWSWILSTLVDEEVPSNLLASCRSYFRDRWVTYRSSGVYKSMMLDRGCPQGSVSGPAYWNILLNDLLKTELSDTQLMVAYADDLILGVSGTGRDNTLKEMETLVQKVGEWLDNHKLSLNPDKCLLMPVFGLRHKYPKVVPWTDMSKLVVKYGGKAIRAAKYGEEMSDLSMKYLGVHLDPRLSFEIHHKKVVGKGQRVAAAFARMGKAHYGPSFPALKRIHESVVVPTVLYCAEVWAERFERGEVTTKWSERFSAAERPTLRAVVRAERWVANDALPVLTGVLPLRLAAKGLVRLSRAIRNGECEAKHTLFDLGHPARWVRTNVVTGADASDFEYRIYSDGSKSDDQTVGSAFVVYHHSEELVSYRFKLDGFCSVFQAEVLGIAKALVWVEENVTAGRVLLLCDNQAAVASFGNPACRNPGIVAVREVERRLKERGVVVCLTWVKAHVGTVGNERADTLANEGRTEGEKVSGKPPLCHVKSEIYRVLMDEWQVEWNRTEDGQRLKSFCVHVQSNPFRRFWSDYYTTQVLTGHGDFNAYLHQRKLVESAQCLFCGDPDDSVDHFLYQCPVFETLRCSGYKDLLLKAQTEGEGVLLVDSGGVLFREYCHRGLTLKRALRLGGRSDVAGF